MRTGDVCTDVRARTYVHTSFGGAGAFSVVAVVVVVVVVVNAVLSLTKDSRKPPPKPTGRQPIPGFCCVPGGRVFNSTGQTGGGQRALVRLELAAERAVCGGYVYQPQGARTVSFTICCANS